MKDGSTSLYLDIYYKGKRSYEFLNIYLSNKRKDTKENSDKRKIAEKIRGQYEYEMILKDNGLNDTKKKTGDFMIFFEDVAINEKKGRKSWICTLHILEKYLEKNPRLMFSEIDTLWLLEFQKYLIGKLKNNSALTYLTCMSIALNIAVEQRIIAENPFKRIPQNKKLKKEEVERTFLTIEEINLLAKSMNITDRQFQQVFLFSCFTGLRWSDVNILKWDDFDNTGEKDKQNLILRFRQKKTGTYEYMPLSEQAKEILKDRKNDHNSLCKKINKDKRETEQAEYGKIYVFPQAMEPKNEKESNNQKVNRILKNWAKVAGLKKNLHFHASRHTFATLSLTYGTDLYTVSKLLGHRNIQTTTVYAKVIDRLKTEAVAKLPLIEK